METIVIQPKRPIKPGWKLHDRIYLMGFPAERWLKLGGYYAITSVETVDAENLGPEYHLSVTRCGWRLDAQEIPEILATFQMEGADEDNHFPGRARHFWMPVNESLRGYVCECKKDEPAIQDGDYIWRKLG